MAAGWEGLAQMLGAFLGGRRKRKMDEEELGLRKREMDLREKQLEETAGIKREEMERRFPQRSMLDRIEDFGRDFMGLPRGVATTGGIVRPTREDPNADLKRKKLEEQIESERARRDRQGKESERRMSNLDKVRSKYGTKGGMRDSAQRGDPGKPETSPAAGPTMKPEPMKLPGGDQIARDMKMLAARLTPGTNPEKLVRDFLRKQKARGDQWVALYKKALDDGGFGRLIDMVKQSAGAMFDPTATARPQ